MSAHAKGTGTDQLDSLVVESFPEAEIALLSESNNKVWKVVLPTKEILVFKQISDIDIPVDYMIDVGNSLSHRGVCSVPAKIIYRDQHQTAIVMPFVDGQPVNEWLSSVDDSHSIELFARFMSEFLIHCRDLPRLRSGYGLYKKDAPFFDSPHEFISFYANKYWARVRPKLDPKIRAVSFIDRWLSGGLRGVAAGTEGVTVSIDSNLKNFLRLQDGSFCSLNVPIVGFSTRAHALGAASFHLRYTPCWPRFWQQSSAELPEAEAVAALQLELWQVLGVMSFYSGRVSTPPEAWSNWGSAVTLLHHLNDLVDQLEGNYSFRS